MPDLSKEKARELMERAVEVMRESVQEPRDDKVGPSVGAVLLKQDGSIDTACRGELRDGDHAEYTLLERKNRDTKLDGSALFATLEPCAPDARTSPKLGCAERIVLARIQTIYVGIEDPDPTVAGQGLDHLRQNGVEIHMFDRDLQDQIRLANRTFLEQATLRAEAVEERATAPPALDQQRGRLDLLSKEALEVYRQAAHIQPEVSTDAFQSRLVAAGFLMDEDGELRPTGHGLLLFGRQPRDTFPQAALLAHIRYPDGSDEREEFSGPLLLIPRRVEQWLKDKLPNVMDRSAMERREVPPLPFEMVREAVVNALVHRDYDIEGAKCQLIVTPDTITVKSPGQPPEPLTVQQLQEFEVPTLSRNPELHFAFARAGLAEEMGFGIPSLRDRAAERGLPLPAYTFESPYLSLVMYRHPDAILPSAALDVLSESEREGWKWLAQRETIRASDYAEHLGVEARTARRHLKHFVELGLVEQLGAGRSTTYRRKIS